jgi:hypothetical protein
MSRYVSHKRSFRPQLECLERRDVPSSLSSETTALTKAYGTLQTDVGILVNTPNPSPFAANQRINTMVNSDVAPVQSAYNSLKGTVKQDQTLMLLGLSYSYSTGNLNGEYFFLAGLAAVAKANQQLTSIPGQVTGLGNETLKNYAPLTVNGAQADFNFPPLKISG